MDALAVSVTPFRHTVPAADMFLLDARLAQSIVDRTMQILDTNVNVMDERGLIIASGDRRWCTINKYLYNRCLASGISA